MRVSFFKNIVFIPILGLISCGSTNEQKNDGFAPISTGVEEYRLLVYNRWGKLIFDEIGESPIWDGNNANGIPCKTDSYSYIIDYKTFLGESHTTNGVVFLIR